MPPTKEQNRLTQAAYYKAHKFDVLRNRVRRKLMRGDLVRPVTIRKYKLAGEAQAMGYNHPISVVTKFSSNALNMPEEIKDLNRELAKEVEARVRSKLGEYDSAIKRAIQKKERELMRVKEGLERTTYPDGKISVEQLLEIIGQIPKYKSHKTVENYRRNIRDIFGRFLRNPDRSNVIGEFSNSTNMIAQIGKGTKVKKGSGGQRQPYADYSPYYGMGVTLYENVAEFRQHMTHHAYRAYKDKFNESNVESAVRQKNKKDSEEIPHLSQFHLVRLNYAKDYPCTTEHLLAALYTLEPAKRNDWGCVRLLFNNEIVKSEKEWQKNNWLLMPQGKVVFHKFKTDHASGHASSIGMMDGGETYGKLVVVLDNLLTKLIALWLKKTGNKTYLLTKVNGKPYAGCVKASGDSEQASQVGTMVTRTFNKYMKWGASDKNMGINRLRQAWVNSLKGEKDLAKRVKLARRMGHSLQTAMLTYERADEGVIAGPPYIDTADGEEMYDYGHPKYPWSDSDILNNRAGRLAELYGSKSDAKIKGKGGKGKGKSKYGAGAS